VPLFYIGGGLPLEVDVHFFPVDGKNEPKKISKKLSPAFALRAINARGDFFRPPRSNAPVPLRRMLMRKLDFVAKNR
jgi:hypothetical protein